MSQYRIFPGNAPANVSIPEAGGTVTNVGAGTVYYGGSRTVSDTVNDGSLAPAASVTLYGATFLYVARTGVACDVSVTSLSVAGSGGGVPAVVAAGSLGATPTINLASTTSGTVFVEGALTANCALTLSNLRACNVVLLLTQDTTARTLSVNGTALTIPTTSGAAFRVDIAVDGTNVYVAEVGAQGDAGAQGPQGDAGPTGATGSTGADGQTTVTENTQVASYTLVLADAGKSVGMNSASATVLTVPPNSTVAFPIGTVIEVCRLGAGVVTIAQGASVVLRNYLEAAGTTNRTVNAQYSSASLRKRATDEWVLDGNLA